MFWRFGKGAQWDGEWTRDFCATRALRRTIAMHGILTKDTKTAPDIADRVYEMPFITDKIYSPDGAIDMKGLKAALQLVADAGEVPAAKLPAPETLILPAELGRLLR